jgi:uncharacterized protein with FMN-binding domain
MSPRLNKSHWKTLAVLLLTTAFLAAAVFGTNMALQGQFEKNRLDDLKRIPRMVLPEGDLFDEYQGNLAQGASLCYVARNGAGIAVVSERETARGGLKVMVGVNAQGRITAVAILEQEYTEGSEKDVADPEYLSVYIGRTVLSAASINSDYEIDAVPGAEESSDAVYQSVKTALLQYMIIENAKDNAKVQEGGGN